jgi:hypothetical protein
MRPQIIIQWGLNFREVVVTTVFLISNFDDCVTKVPPAFPLSLEVLKGLNQGVMGGSAESVDTVG